MKCDVHYEKTPRMNSHGLHAHDYYEFYMHYSGGRYYCVDDITYRLEPDMLIIIPPLHMHGLVCDRDLENYERGYFYMAADNLQKFGMGEINISAIIEEQVKKGSFIYTIPHEQADNFRKLLINLRDNEKKLSHMEQNLNIMTLLNIVMASFKEGQVERPFDIPSKESSVLGVFHYINNHFTEELTIGELSHLFNMSESALSHEFRKYTNKSVYDYILYKRIIMAKELLYKDMSLTEIAFNCGFNDYSNFLRAFRKINGKSPREYRKGKE